MPNYFINNLYSNGSAVVEENIYESLFQEYERIVVQSLITSFGLDFFFRDQHGGDVDTVHNVRNIGTDPQMYYKNLANQVAYERRGKYDFGTYHSDPRFRETKTPVRDRWRETGVDIEDVYTGKSIGFHGHTNAISPEKKADLDHIVECAGIHNDRGRVLAGLDGVDLANQPENLAWTNEQLNRSMGSWARHVNDKYKKEHNGMDAPLSEVDALAYIKAHPELDETTKQRLTKQYTKAKKAYDAQIERSYYSSKKFQIDTAKAAGRMGLKMGLRQALGLVFAEIWFAVKEEIENGKENEEEFLRCIGNGVQIGSERALRKYKDVIGQFMNGALSGILASLTTTICNIFFSTAKHLVRIIRQSWASLVEATNILLFNPDCLSFGERVLAASKLIATGASIVAGQMISGVISESPLGKIPVIGDVVSTFCGTLITGIMSCSFLYFLDHNSTVKKIIDSLNRIPTIEDQVIYHKQLSVLLEIYSAKLYQIDVKEFIKEADQYTSLLNEIEGKDDKQVNILLHQAYHTFGFDMPYEDLDEAMTKPGLKLHFS